MRKLSDFDTVQATVFTSSSEWSEQHLHSGKTPGNNFFLKTYFIFYINISNADSKILEFWIKFSKNGP
jgi:hypothetical protein